MDEKRKKFLKMVEEYKKKREAEKAEMAANPEKFKPKWPYELFGIECREGWKHLYQPLIDYVEEYNKTHKEKMEIHQIKEKFGGLRFYTNFCDEKLRDMIRYAEAKSYNTCEVCGKHIDKPITENYWIYAECEDCHKKWLDERNRKLEENYKKIKNMNSENKKS